MDVEKTMEFILQQEAKIEAHLQAEMQKIAGGLPLPPGMKLPF